LLDRFDIRMELRPGGDTHEPSADVRARVIAAVERQRERLRGTPWRRNAHVPAGALERYVALTPEARALWHHECQSNFLTGRGAARIRRVARTIADLEDRTAIDAADISEAAMLREDLW
jgi:magnesium chelatase family protein